VEIRSAVTGVATVLLMSSAGCVKVKSVLAPAPIVPSAAQLEADSLEVVAEAKRRTREAVPSHPVQAQPTTTQGTQLWKSALSTRGTRVVVSTESRALWLMRDTVVLFIAPVAVGMEDSFTYKGKRYTFTTPLGRRKVLEKDTMPLWVPPEWHYYELATQRGLDVVMLKAGARVELSDSTTIEVRGSDVGRVNQFGNFWPFTPGAEMIFDGRIFVPPYGTRQRQVPDVLGTHKLVMGEGYLIHGTNSELSIGDAVSHGCVRMYNEDVARLYQLVPVGTPVFIY
jgi:hypothetical protein